MNVARLPATLAPLIAACLTGCSGGGRSAQSSVEATPTSVRSARRAYDGAPPVIPHALLGSPCLDCHTATGRVLPGLGIAPASPHAPGDAAGRLANCRACHVPATTTNVLIASTFQGLPQTPRRGERGSPGGPPVVPHERFLRESCTACHAGPAARPEIVCGHPERANCVQCHVGRFAASDAMWPAIDRP